MRSSTAFLVEKKIKKMPFQRLPKIGWWEDNDPIRVYHGTHIHNIEWIEKNGIMAPTTGYTAGVVSLALEPNTSWGYAAMSGMGGESGGGVKAKKGTVGFRDAGATAVRTPDLERVVFVIDFPKSYLMRHIAPINYESSQKKLTDRSLFDAWKRSDQEYYAITELKFLKTVELRYIKGYMTK